MVKRSERLLMYLPNISKFKTDNLINIIGIFSECNALLEIPDISKWFINLKKSNPISIEEIDDIFKTLNEKNDDDKLIINYKDIILIDIKENFGKIGLCPINEKTEFSNWLKK